MATKKGYEERDPWFAEHAKNRDIADAIKRGPLAGLFSDPNIVGMAYGQREANGVRTGEPALVVYVAKKMPRRYLPVGVQVPRRWQLGGDCIEVDVIETGFMYPHAFTAGERPAPSGISIGNGNQTGAGTLGCLVTDNADNTLCILTNNHVIAALNTATLGDPVVQQAVFDGGSSPGDDIGTLKRFVTINASGNTVDAAIAQVTTAGDVVNQMKDNLMPIATVDHPAVGLLFAGSCGRTLMNPIANVLNQMNVRFPGTGAGAGAGQPIVAARVGMDVEKVGRTTEYTTSTITEIDVTTSVNYTGFGSRGFDNQIATSWMSDPGDSGSLVCRGGEGGAINNCSGCGAQSTATKALGEDLSTEAQLAKEVRDKYLRHTRIGRWAVDLYYLNEERFVARFEAAHLEDKDRDFGKKLFAKYAADARAAAASPERTTQKVTNTHIKDAEAALRRARPYLTPEELDAAEKLMAMAKELLPGLTLNDALALLDNEELFDDLKAIVEFVPSVKTEECRCD